MLLVDFFVDVLIFYFQLQSKLENVLFSRELKSYRLKSQTLISFADASTYQQPVSSLIFYFLESSRKSMRAYSLYFRVNLVIISWLKKNKQKKTWWSCSIDIVLLYAMLCCICTPLLLSLDEILDVILLFLINSCCLIWHRHYSIIMQGFLLQVYTPMDTVPLFFICICFHSYFSNQLWLCTVSYLV